ncbi:hypothetical protein Scep_026834 [Stephania cephalantha]|uniref:3-hydroxyisobutyryl-CoA hydrolase n=1 Tax=Stephania cephalantha TaxID=152367 RepID=A0AAP0EKX0_9MAGN
MGLAGFRHSPLHLRDTRVMGLGVVGKHEIDVLKRRAELHIVVGKVCDGGCRFVEQQQTGEGEYRRLPLSSSATLLTHLSLEFLCYLLPESIGLVSIINGIVMGGDASLSMLGRFRVVTENAVFAMREASLGLSPTSYFLSGLPSFFAFAVPRKGTVPGGFCKSLCY